MSRLVATLYDVDEAVPIVDTLVNCTAAGEAEYVTLELRTDAGSVVLAAQDRNGLRHLLMDAMRAVSR